jgi:predicted HicB family RNase H-like nuclease
LAEPSGKTQIRLPPALHAHLIDRAEQQGISLNALMVALLAGGSNFKLPTK